MMKTLDCPQALSAILLSAIGTISLAGAPEAWPPYEGKVIVPTAPIVLFNGKDLTNFYIWLQKQKFDDPKRVFTVVDQVDGAPAIRVSGEELGGIITKEVYANYHLIAEYRWGSATWGARKDKPRDSGILLHAQGPEGNYRPDYTSPWMHSIECQIIEGETGDIILVQGHTKDGRLLMPFLTGTVSTNYRGQTVWDPNGETRTFNAGRIYCSYCDPDLKDVVGTRGQRDVEKPVGQWNRIEAICKDDTLTYVLNGEIINKATHASLTSGRILFQSEGAEIFFRRIELHPLR